MSIELLIFEVIIFLEFLLINALEFILVIIFVMIAFIFDFVLVERKFEITSFWRLIFVFFDDRAESS